MRMIGIVTLGVIGFLALSTAFTGLASAQTQQLPSGQYPNVSNLKAFSPEANFMSLPGYLRYLVYQKTGQWITYAEAGRVVTQQRGM
jgi:hypothetical protein